jgi:hypothetical protein
VGTAIVLITLFILNSFFMDRPITSRQQQLQHINAMRKRMMMVRKSTNDVPLVSVVAPWTKMIMDHAPDVVNAPPGTTTHSIKTRSFVFADVKQLDVDYGTPMTPLDQDEHKQIQKLLEKRLCLRSAKKTIHQQATQKCKRKVQILKCVSCTEQDGTWYSAVSQSATVFGRVMYENSNSSMTVHFPNYNDGPFMYESLDIAVPIAGQDDKLVQFAARLGPSIRQFRSGLLGAKVAIRLLVTRFPFDDPSPHAKDAAALEAFRQNLTSATGLSDTGDGVVFVPVGMDENLPEFSRAKAINVLHQITHHNDRTVLAAIDVDLQVGPKFLRNALTFPFPQSAAYFPIMWSQYSPETVDLVDEFMPKLKQSKFSEHHGHWRKFSFGMYAIAGSDAARLAMDESFVGWGGEDNDFFAKTKEKLNIIRLRETGLTHVWHAKHCNLGGFVKNKYFRECVASMAHFEGSQLGMHLKFLKDNNRTDFDQIMAAAKQREESGKESGNALDLESQQVGEEDSPTILVGVVSSRDNFATRVKGIIETWGDPLNIPEGTQIRFFVGAPPESSEFYQKPQEDVANLAAMAGIKDLSTIFVMDGVVDNEYPPVRKNTAMIASLNKIVETFENDVAAPSTFQWIYKVDDDAYVNFDGMLSFIKTRSSEQYHVYGERGTGREEDRDGLRKAGLVKPYCTGGPGYIMSRKTVKETAPNLKQCVRDADTSEYRQFLWHSDSVIGLCIYKNTGAGCWDEGDYFQNRIFRHNLHNDDPFLKKSQLPKTVACHPFKDQESMTRHHMRYVQIAALSR